MLYTYNLGRKGLILRACVSCVYELTLNPFPALVVYTTQSPEHAVLAVVGDGVERKGERTVGHPSHNHPRARLRGPKSCTMCDEKLPPVLGGLLVDASYVPGFVRILTCRRC